LQFVLHIHAYTCQISKEHTGGELTGIIVHGINSESGARALVVVAVSLVKSNQISLVQLVLELSSEIDHESIFGSSLNRSSVG